MGTMKVKLLAFGIAMEIIQARSMEFQIHPGETIASLKEKLLVRYPEFSKLKTLSLAVGENYQEDSFALSDEDEVAIIPPVSGG